MGNLGCAYGLSVDSYELLVAPQGLHYSLGRESSSHSSDRGA